MPDGLNIANSADVRATIRDYLIRVTRKSDLSDNHDIFRNGIVNSLFAVEIVCFIEEAFGIVVENDDLDIANFCSVDALTEFVGQKSAAA